MLLHIRPADFATQTVGQGGDDVVERFGHRDEGVVGAEDDVVGAEYVDCGL